METHLEAALAPGGAPIDAIRPSRERVPDRITLLNWLECQGLRNLDGVAFSGTGHSVATCTSARTTWKWIAGNSSWLFPSNPPHHLYDFAC